MRFKIETLEVSVSPNSYKTRVLRIDTTPSFSAKSTSTRCFFYFNTFLHKILYFTGFTIRFDVTRLFIRFQKTEILLFLLTNKSTTNDIHLRFLQVPYEYKAVLVVWDDLLQDAKDDLSPN